MALTTLASLTGIVKAPHIDAGLSYIELSSSVDMPFSSTCIEALLQHRALPAVPQMLTSQSKPQRKENYSSMMGSCERGDGGWRSEWPKAMERKKETKVGLAKLHLQYGAPAVCRCQSNIADTCVQRAHASAQIKSQLALASDSAFVSLPKRKVDSLCNGYSAVMFESGNVF